jgi:hypothetical protein
MTGLLQLSGQATINTTTPGVGNYGRGYRNYWCSSWDLCTGIR